MSCISMIEISCLWIITTWGGVTTLRPPFKMTLQDFRNAMNSKFVFMDDIIDSVYYAITSKKNMILHGPGGHAKSQIVEEALKLFIGEEKFYSDVFLANCAEDMDVSPIMGYDNIPKFQTEGVLEKVVNDTIFLKHKFAILEEGLDAPGMLITALKDPLMRGYLCINGTCVPNQLQSLFICTNVNPEKWAGQERTRLALLQRFRFSVEVAWPSYTTADFNTFLNKIGKPNPVVAKFGEICHKAGWQISPRSLKDMEDVYSAFGVKALKHFESIPEAVYKQLCDFEKNVPFVKELTLLQQRLDKVLETAQASPRNAIVECTKIRADAKKIKNIPTDGSFSGMLRQILLDADALIDSCNKIPATTL